MSYGGASTARALQRAMKHLQETLFTVTAVALQDIVMGEVAQAPQEGSDAAAECKHATRGLKS